ncbi:hypothetical protein ACH4ZX_12900 [Streptomyces sp. NPDC020490]|uniref:hypothetical protein n=1 Tax=Streptomyces sp. NPDC020490 TaxID=3365078 RepID=UPI003788396A
MEEVEVGEGGGLQPPDLQAAGRTRGAHYIAQAKANHPGLFDRVRRLPRGEITLDHHGRTRARI